MARSAEDILRSFDEDLVPDVRSVRTQDEVACETYDVSFGQYLRRQRVLRDIGREEILAATKVSEEYYDALESNRFEELPPKAFVIGFLRVLSQYAGLDSDEVVNRYLAQLNQEQGEVLLEAELEEEVPSRWKRHSTKILAILGAVVLMGLMFAPLLRG